jgi:hypothetical protein
VGASAIRHIMLTALLAGSAIGISHCSQSNPSEGSGAAPPERVRTVEAQDDSKGGKLICRKGNESMTIDVPAHGLAKVMEQVAAPLGYEKSDCTFYPNK